MRQTPSDGYYVGRAEIRRLREGLEPLFEEYRSYPKDWDEPMPKGVFITIVVTLILAGYQAGELVLWAIGLVAL